MIREWFTRFAALMPEPLLLVAGDGLVLGANRVAEASLGALEGKRLTELATGSPDKLLDYLRMCGRTRSMLPGALRVRRDQGGTEAFFRVHGALFSLDADVEGTAIVLRLQAAADAPSRFALLTEKIDALTREIARRSVAEAALAEREEHIRVVLTSIGDAVVVTDARGAISFTNGIAEKLTGWSERDARGRPLAEVFVIVDETTGLHIESPVDRVLREGAPVGMSDRTILVARDGSKRPIDDSAAPLRTSAGKLDGAVLVFRDVTERRKAEHEREALLEREQTARLAAESARSEAERANRAKDEFLAMLGHELRNPLAPIVTALDLLAAPDVATLEPARLVVERQVGHMARLVDDLLDVSRIARGEVTIEKRIVEIYVPATKAIEMAAPALERAGHSLAVLVPEHGLAVEGDATRLAQVVANLLSNAARFTEPGGHITLTAVAEGTDVVLRVSDNGIGIRAEILPRIFDMFTQERQTAARSRGGLGLGLAIAQNLMRAHGGSIAVRSGGEGKGSEFSIRLPAARVPASGAADQSAVVSASTGASERLRILVVDDNEDAAKMLSLSLGRLGHATLVVHDGPAALRAVEAFAPDVAFLDIGLPDMDGYELAGRLRALPHLQRIHLVALTGYGQDADRRRAEDAGFDVHLVKPVTRAAFKALLEGLATKRNAS